jgi:hypothetical protein
VARDTRNLPNRENGNPPNLRQVGKIVTGLDYISSEKSAWSLALLLLLLLLRNDKSFYT